MQNNFLKLILFNLFNEFLNVLYIQLVIFLFISFKYIFLNFFYEDCIFPKYIFQLLEKKKKKKRMWREK
jgi:hypothetical protein